MIDLTSLILIGKKAEAMEAKVTVTIQPYGLHILASMRVARCDRLSEYEAHIVYEALEIPRPLDRVFQAIEHANRMAKEAARG